MRFQDLNQLLALVAHSRAGNGKMGHMTFNPSAPELNPTPSKPPMYAYPIEDPTPPTHPMPPPMAFDVDELRFVPLSALKKMQQEQQDERGLDGDVTGVVTDAAYDELEDANPCNRWIDQREDALDVLHEVFTELGRAIKKHDSFNSAHEGASVIREEFEELWDHVKDDTGYTGGARKEAIQLAAMAVRYVLDLDPSDD